MRITEKLGSTAMAVIVTVAVLSLSACGQTGDLYLPEPEKQTDQEKNNTRETTEDGSF